MKELKYLFELLPVVLPSSFHGPDRGVEQGQEGAGPSSHHQLQHHQHQQPLHRNHSVPSAGCHYQQALGERVPTEPFFLYEYLREVKNAIDRSLYCSLIDISRLNVRSHSAGQRGFPLSRRNYVL